MSFNNKWFLFYNRKTEKLCVYELKATGSSALYTFVLSYELDDNNFMFNHCHSLGVDPIAFYRVNISQIKINDEGKVKLCYVENLPVANNKEIDSKDPTNEISNVQCRLLGVIFTPEEGKYIMKGKCFTEMIEFPKDA
jgi:hypothetical protein